MLNEHTGEELHRLNDNFFRAFMSSPVAMAITRLADGKFLTINQMYTRIMGYQPEEILGRTADDLGIYARLHERNLLVRQLREQGFVHSYELLVKDKSGDERNVLVSMEPTVYDNEEAVISSFTDLTAQKRAEKALRKSEEQFRNIFQHHSAVKLLIDPDTGIIFQANDAAEQFYGWSSAELMKMKIQDINILSPEQIKSEMEKARSLKRTYFEFGHRLADGSVRDVEVYSSKVEVNGKELLHSIVHDITERKQAEVQRIKSHELLLNLARLVPGVIYQYRLYPDGRSAFPYASPGMSDIYEVSPEEVREDATPVYGRLHPDDYDLVVDTIQESARTLRTFYCEFRVNLPRQGIRWRWSQAHPERMPDGSILWHGIISDITESKRMEEQLHQTQKMEAIGTLAGGIAHDFNNILFPIVGFTEMLLEDVPEGSDIRSSLDQIYIGALRARELVQQILAFSRQEKSELAMMKMQPIIKEVLKLIRSSLPATISISQNIQPGCGPVKADPTQIHQIVMNLATNAFHAMTENGGTLNVSLREIELDKNNSVKPDMAPGLYACLTVTDTGTGMTPAVMSRIFEPFFTTKEKGKGTGMGLSVVYEIVKSMNGAIQVHSEPGIGTEFHIYLPVVKDNSEKKGPPIKEPLPGGSERILLVDDEAAIITMEKQILTRLGYHVTSCAGSIEALEVFRSGSEQYDLVITDMFMPVMSGDKLAAELLRIRPDIPILICTGFSETMTNDKIKSLGIRGLLMKPIVTRDLAKKVRAVLE